MPSTALMVSNHPCPRITPLAALRRRPDCEPRFFIRESYHSPDILPSVGTIKCQNNPNETANAGAIFGRMRIQGLALGLTLAPQRDHHRSQPMALRKKAQPSEMKAACSPWSLP